MINFGLKFKDNGRKANTQQEANCGQITLEHLEEVDLSEKLIIGIRPKAFSLNWNIHLNLNPSNFFQIITLQSASHSKPIVGI